MKSLDQQITALENQLSMMKSKRMADMTKAYANLVGTCMKANHSAYHMITAILEVKELTFDDPEIKDDKEISYQCIQVWWNPRENPKWRTAEISLHQQGRIEASKIERLKIPFPKFKKALDDCMEWIRENAETVNSAKMDDKQ